MNCNEAEQFFDAYLDDELSGSIRLEFDAHRLRCPVCQQKLAMMEACEHIVARDARLPSLSDGFTERVMGAIGGQRVIKLRTRRRRLVFAAAALMQAAAVLVIAIVWTSGQPAQTGAIDGVEARTTFLSEVEDAIDKKDRVELLDLIYGRADQVYVARYNLQDEVSRLASYAANLSVLGDISLSPDSIGENPLSEIMGILVPASPEEPEPSSDASGPVRL